MWEDRRSWRHRRRSAGQFLPLQELADVHAWAFTPESFRLLMVELRLLRLTGLTATFVSSTYGNQFCAVLEHAPREGSENLSSATRQTLERERLALSRSLRLA